MAKKAKVNVVVQAFDNTKKAFGSAGKNAKGLQTSIFEVTATISSLTTIARSAISVVTSFGNMVKSVATTVIGAAMEQEKAQAQLAATLKSTSHAAGFTLKEMEAMASAFQSVTTYGDETVMGMQSILATFTKIGKDTFPTASMAILDMSAKMGTDLKGAALQVGKALNDPVIGVTALREVGVSFTESQVDMIKAMAKTGDVAGAQALMLAELQVEFGGSAVAARKTFGGALDSLKNSFSDVLEGLGEFITQNEYLVRLMDGMAGIFDDLAKDFKGLEVSMEDQERLAKIVQDSMADLIGTFADILDGVAGLITGFEKFKAIILTGLLVIGGGFAALKIIVLGWVGVIEVAIMGTLATIGAVATYFLAKVIEDELSPRAQEAADKLHALADTARVVEAKVRALGLGSAGAADGVGDLSDALGKSNYFADLLAKSFKKLHGWTAKLIKEAGEFNLAWKGMNFQLTDGVLSVDKVTAAFLAANPTLENFKTFTGDAAKEMMGFVTEIEKLSDGQKIGDIVQGLEEWAVNTSKLSLKEQAVAVAEMSKRLGEMASALKRLSEIQASFAERAKAAAEWQAKLKDANNDHITTINENLASIKKLVGEEGYKGWVDVATALQKKLKTGNMTLSERNNLLAEFAAATSKAADAAKGIGKVAAQVPDAPRGKEDVDPAQVVRDEHEAQNALALSKNAYWVKRINANKEVIAQKNLQKGTDTSMSSSLRISQAGQIQHWKEVNRQAVAANLPISERVKIFEQMNVDAEEFTNKLGKSAQVTLDAMKAIAAARKTAQEAAEKAAQEAIDKEVKMRTDAIEAVKNHQEAAMLLLTRSSEVAAEAVAKAWEEAARMVSDAANQQLILLKLIVLGMDKYVVSSSGGGGGSMAGNPGGGMAHGGYVNRPTYAMIGEAGPETVIPESKPERAMELLSGLFRRNPNLLGSMGNGPSGGSRGSSAGGVSITVNNMMGDGDEIANTLASRMDEILGRRTN